MIGFVTSFSGVISGCSTEHIRQHNLLIAKQRISLIQSRQIVLKKHLWNCNHSSAPEQGRFAWLLIISYKWLCFTFTHSRQNCRCTSSSLYQPESQIKSWDLLHLVHCLILHALRRCFLIKVYFSHFEILMDSYSLFHLETFCAKRISFIFDGKIYSYNSKFF